MKVNESTSFNKEYPERFGWGRIDSITYSDLANTISIHVEHEIRNKLPEDRVLTPGLRKTLCLIAEKAEI